MFRPPLALQRCAFLKPQRNSKCCYSQDSSWAKYATTASNRVQAYLSKSDDPFVNLSVEHFLLQNTPHDSAVLFLYVNRPCVVIGRNQNPWTEVNLNLVFNKYDKKISPLQRVGAVDLVRRRSGGGAVFHDEGNINWTVISPSESFTRDKHAEMIVRALRENGVTRSRVNERHDIVLDQGDECTSISSSDADLHTTPWTPRRDHGTLSLKVSGSAYKLTRGRALHHGTCLLSSPNLPVISNYLRAPGREYIKARGVESVRSPVDNIGVSMDDFINSVKEQFRRMYSPDRVLKQDILSEAMSLDEPLVRKGVEELRTPEWIFNQTPQFAFSTTPFEGDDRPRPTLPVGFPPDFKAVLHCRHGQIVDSNLAYSLFKSSGEIEVFKNLVKDRYLHEDWTWEEIFNHKSLGWNISTVKAVAPWFQNSIPTGLSNALPAS